MVSIHRTKAERIGAAGDYQCPQLLPRARLQPWGERVNSEGGEERQVHQNQRHEMKYLLKVSLILNSERRIVFYPQPACRLGIKYILNV